MHEQHRRMTETRSRATRARPQLRYCETSRDSYRSCRTFLIQGAGSKDPKVGQAPYSL
jgi:hypothetical protein